ncbi:KIF13B [Symbiodinium sp. CCMP2592]|nr:KIF13B [Symbiodinium sp. CCMP2592]
MSSLKARKDGQLLEDGQQDPDGASSNDERTDGCMVRKWLSPGAAAKGLVVMMCVSLTYHALILTGKVDYRYVWGGQLNSKDEMYTFEAISVSLNLLMLLLVLTRGGWLNACPCLPASVLRALCAVFCGLFACNTVGNALAKTNFERCVFFPLTLLSAVAFARWVDGSPPAQLMCKGRKDRGKATIGAVVFHTLGGHPSIFDGSLPSRLVESWQRYPDEQIISQAELAAVVCVRYMLCTRLSGRKCFYFVDNVRLRNACNDFVGTTAASLQPLPAGRGPAQVSQSPPDPAPEILSQTEATVAEERPLSSDAGSRAALSCCLLPAGTPWRVGRTAELKRPGTTLEPRRYAPTGGVFDLDREAPAPEELCSFLLPCVQQAVAEAHHFCLWLHGPRGSGKSRLAWGDEQRPGLADLLAHGAFRALEGLGFSEPLPEDSVLMTVQFLKIGVQTELCGDCLLGADFDASLKTREALLGGGFVMEGVPEREVRSLGELRQLLRCGAAALRQAGAFRSGQTRTEDAAAHGLCTIRIRRTVGSTVYTSTFHLLDLVGAEATAAGTKTSRKDDRTLKSMLRLVDALAESPDYVFRDGRTAPRHIPYRDAKVTRLLRQCFGGPGRAVLLALSGGSDHDAALASLELAARHERGAGKLEPCLFDRSAMLRDLSMEVAKYCAELGFAEAPAELKLDLNSPDAAVHLAEALQQQKRVKEFEDWTKIRQASLAAQVSAGRLRDPKMLMDPDRNPTRCAKKLENTIRSTHLPCLPRAGLESEACWD